MSHAPNYREYSSRSPDQTLALGRAIGSTISPGTVIALAGPLGAGKTHLTKGIALGLGIPADEPIVSPTFVIAREYGDAASLIHADLYRVTSVEELDALGLDERRAAGSFIVVEWADRFPEAWDEHAIHIELAHASVHERHIRIIVIDPTLHAWLRALPDSV